jgi:UDP-N-acetylmuramate: L-alanyl-gamma-D-glutamyl-meso-diaminopimelate ligase
MHYHLIGIAGTAMGSLAGLLHQRGHRVTGSDEGVYPPMSTLLDSMDVAYALGFDPANLDPTPDVVVVGNAISRGNPELEAVLDRGLRYTSAASLVREEFLEGKHVLAVAGTHGKTTTSALLAWILEAAGLKPSFLVGGVCRNFGTSFRLTDSDYFVIEADEYDTAYFDKGPKMWHYRPQTAVVTNIEFDHSDIYRDAEAYRLAFARFINLIPCTGTLVAGWSSPVVRALSDASLASVESFGLEASGSHPRWLATDIEFGPEGTEFVLLDDEEPLGSVRTPLWGAFNVENCLAAIAAARAVGANLEAVISAVRTFESVGRRLEIRGEAGGVTVVDDFAHHPTAVRGAIAAASERFPGRRVVAIFEPRSYTVQRKESQEAIRESLRGANRVVIAGLFHPERYDDGTGMDPEALAHSLRLDGVVADYLPEVDRIVDIVVSEARPSDVLLVLSNGDFGGIHEKLLDRLKQ